MKKKIFSAMLLFAFTLGTTSTFVSCKDYDDEINALQDDVKALKSADELFAKTTDMQSAIASAKSELQSEIDAVDKTATAAQKAANANADSIAKLKETTAKALSDAAAALEEAGSVKSELAKLTSEDGTLAKMQAAIDANKKAAETADAAAKAAQSELDVIKGDKYTKDLTLSNLNTRLATVEGMLGIGEATGEVNLSALNAKVDSIETVLKNIIGEYSTMVTGVSLFYDATQHDGQTGVQPLVFNKVTEQANTFGSETDGPLTFTKDYIKTYETSLVVRINPTTADMTKSAAKINLINSQGDELSEFVECSKVEPYTELLTTRAASANNGLWKLTFKLKDGYDPDAFLAAVQKDKKSILFAVAVKNTTLSTDERRVISTYALTVDAKDATIAGNAFEVTNMEGNWIDIANIHNRYSACEDGTSTANVKELTWKEAGKAYTTVVTEGDKANAEDRGQSGFDNRQDEALLTAEVNKAINIRIAYDAKEKKYQEIAGFYVVLDEDFALESAPSEVNAWESYSYENVGTKTQKAHMFKGNEGQIMVKSSQSINDIIGFRVYAVNLDGTIIDPDGRAFYIVLGNAATANQVSGEIVADKAENAASEAITVAEGFIPSGDLYKDNSGNAASKIASISDLVWTPSDNNPKMGETVAPAFEVKYYDKDGKETTAVKDIVSVKLVMANAADYIDGETYTQTCKIYNKQGFLVKTLTASFTKVMPTECKALTFIKNQNYATYAYRPYMYPEGATEGISAYEITTTKPTAGSKNLKNVFLELSSDNNYSLSFVNCKADKDGKYTENLAVGAPYVVTVNESLIDNTDRTMTYSYVYPKVSSYYDTTSKTWKTSQDYNVNSANTYTVDFACWHHAQTWKMNTYTATEGKNTVTKTREIVLQWKTNGNDNSVEVPLSWIASSNTLNGEAFAKTLDVLLDETGGHHYLKLGSTAEDLKVVIDDPTARYFTGTIADGKITFKQDLQMDQNPTADFTVNASVITYDVFGHKITIKVPVTIKRQPNE